MAPAKLASKKTHSQPHTSACVDVYSGLHVDATCSGLGEGMRATWMVKYVCPIHKVQKPLILICKL